MSIADICRRRHRDQRGTPSGQYGKSGGRFPKRTSFHPAPTPTSPRCQPTIIFTTRNGNNKFNFFLHNVFPYSRQLSYLLLTDLQSKVNYTLSTVSIKFINNETGLYSKSKLLQSADSTVEKKIEIQTSSTEVNWQPTKTIFFVLLHNCCVPKIL